MSNIIVQKSKQSRKVLTNLWGRSKDSFNTKNYKPGQHGTKPKGKVSDYGLHLLAKQRLKFHYGRITEKQFHNLFKYANKMKGNTAENFIGLLESRLDVVVYRLNFAPTIFAARQLVSHGHIRLNGKKVNIASQKLKVGDVIELKSASKQIPLILQSISSKERTVPEYLSLDADNMSGKFIRRPANNEAPYPFDPEIQLVVEWYSR